MSEDATGQVTRRGFLILTGAIAASGGLRPLHVSAQQAPASPPPPASPLVPGKEKLIVRTPKPINLETPLAQLTSYHTPEDLFYVRNNSDSPVIDLSQWSVKIEGEVDQPLVLRMDDLRKLPPITQDAVLECAGNGRSFHRPRASGLQWEYGAVGNATWTGVRLADVLAMAKVRSSGKHVAFDGADKPLAPAAPDFIRSIPIWKALEPHTMIAFEMDGKPLPQIHGAPARVIVPGWIGSASIKWLERIMVIPNEFDGSFMKRSYRAPRAEDEKDTYSLQSLEVKSLILGPLDGAKLQAGPVTLWGWAWSGEGELTGIDVSTDGGQSWKAGRFVGRSERYSWRKWEFDWDAKLGNYTIMARATDSIGRIQPTSRAWNPLGYRWNVIHAIKVEVA